MDHAVIDKKESQKLALYLVLRDSFGGMCSASY